MHVLVTGGTGFIGQTLCRELLARGWRVTVLTRDVARAARLLQPPVQTVSDLAALPAADPPSAVVNLAGENLSAHRWNTERKRVFISSRAGTTRRLVEWMRTLPAPPRALVSGSAVGYYGARGDETLSESSPPGQEYQSDLCRLWEDEALRAEALGVRVCRIRIGIVLGPRGGALAAMLPAFRLGLGGPFGNGRQWISWIHRADLIALILRLLQDQNAAGAYNATAPQPVSNREFARTLGRVLRRPALLPMPGFMVRLLVGEMAHLLLTGQKALPQRLLEQGFRFSFPDLEGALREALRQV